MKLLYLVLLLFAGQAFAATDQELNCNEVRLVNNKGEALDIEFLRLDLYRPLSTETEVLILGAYENPYWRELQHARLSIEKFSLIKEEFLANGLQVKTYKIHFKLPDHLLSALSLDSANIDTICQQI